MVFIASFGHFYFDCDIVGIGGREARDVEASGFFERGCGEVGLVGVFHFGRHIGYYPPIDTCAARVGVHVPAEYRPLCFCGSGTLPCHGCALWRHGYDYFFLYDGVVERFQRYVEHVGAVFHHFSGGGVDGHSRNAAEHEVAPEPSLNFCVECVVGCLVAVLLRRKIFTFQFFAHIGCRKAVGAHFGDGGVSVFVDNGCAGYAFEGHFLARLGEQRGTRRHEHGAGCHRR